MNEDSYFLIDEPYSEEGIQFKPFIFASETTNELIPSQFNAVKIAIDGRADGSLDWKQARQKALHAIGKGLKIFWEIDLGLPHDLQAPLSDSTQFLTLGLSLDHFRDTLWKEMHVHSIGLCLYRGYLESTYRDSLSDYLNLLAMRIPDAIPLFVQLDLSKIDKKFEVAELINKEMFSRFQRLISCSCIPPPVHTGKVLGYISKNCLTIENKEFMAGICLPSQTLSPQQYEEWEKVLKKLDQESITYRFIPESSIATDWDGLDYLVVMSSAISQQGIRKLHGFCAAGGTVLTIGAFLGVAIEKEL